MAALVGIFKKPSGDLQSRGAMPTASDRACLARSSAFHEIDHQNFGDLIANSRTFERPAGAILYRHGEPARCLYLLVVGTVQLYRGGHTARQAVLHVVRPGETFGEPAAMINGRQSMTARAVTAVRFVEVPVDLYWHAIFESPEATAEVVGLLARRLIDAWDTIEALQTNSTTTRLAKYLLRFCGSPTRPAQFELPVDKSLLAANLGMKPETLSRAFAKLRSFGVKSWRRQIRIEDPRYLAANFDINEDN